MPGNFLGIKMKRSRNDSTKFVHRIELESLGVEYEPVIYISEKVTPKVKDVQEEIRKLKHNNSLIVKNIDTIREL